MSFQLSGNAPDIYENTMVPLWFGRWADALLDLASLKPGEAVLDIACGTGVTTRIAKRDVGVSGQVTGLDINAGMLAAARKLATDLDINWIESDVVETGLMPDSFDVIISQHGYHYFPRKPAALKEFLRLLKPTGRIALSIWDGHSAYTKAVCSAVEKYISADIACKQRSQRETPTVQELKQSFRDAGFKGVDVVRQELSIAVPSASEFVPLHLGSMPIAGAFHDLLQGNKDRLISDVACALEPYTVGNQIIYPDVVNVVTGKK